LRTTSTVETVEGRCGPCARSENNTRPRRIELVALLGNVSARRMRSEIKALISSLAMLSSPSWEAAASWRYRLHERDGQPSFVGFPAGESTLGFGKVSLFAGRHRSGRLGRLGRAGENPTSARPVDDAETQGCSENEEEGRPLQAGLWQ